MPTGSIAPAAFDTDRCADKTVMMPRRTHTRAQNRAAAIVAERRSNHQRRTNPTLPATPDEDIEYLDTFVTELSPPPF